MKNFNLLILVIAGTALFYVKTNAQEYPQKDSASLVKFITKDFAVSKGRAEQISTTLKFNRTALEKVIEDRKMDPKERVALIKKLLEERRNFANANLSSEEKGVLKKIEEANIARHRKQMFELGLGTRAREKQKNTE